MEGPREPHQPADDLPARVLAMREAGAAWKDIQAAFNLTRQQARYAYQLGRRAERRAERKRGDRRPD